MDSVQIRSLNAATQEDSRTVPPGKVNQMCKQWLVHEDGGIAIRLQNEEIEQHYDHNRTRNKLVRHDLKEARTLQQSEEQEAEFLRAACETFALEQEEEDARIARQVETQLMLEEASHQKLREQEDERLAKQIQERERQRLERRRREKELREVERAAQRVAECTAPTELPSKALSDFSDLYPDPPEGLTEEELRRFHEEQDAEFARLLQEQETKRSGAQPDAVVAMEAQDWELARLLQEQEQARARRAKLRARQRQQANSPEGSTAAGSPLPPETGNPSTPERSRPPSTTPLPPSDNIAAALDPTYPRHSPSSLGGQRLQYFYEEDEPTPPYMPIQGQRRTPSLSGSKKLRKPKEGCKHQ